MGLLLWELRGLPPCGLTGLLLRWGLMGLSCGLKGLLLRGLIALLRQLLMGLLHWGRRWWGTVRLFRA